MNAAHEDTEPFGHRMKEKESGYPGCSENGIS